MIDRNEFIAAYVKTFGASPEDAGTVYDLLNGPPDEFNGHLDDWVADFKKRTFVDQQPTESIPKEGAPDD